MNLFAFDLRPDAAELFLLKDKKEIYKELNAEKTQSEILLEAIDLFLKENEMPLKKLDLIACNRGPGSFTALRIAMAAAKGLSEGADIPMISVCGLDAYAAFSKECSEILLPVIDGRKKRFYAAFYRAGERCEDYMDLPAEAIVEISPKNAAVAVCGSDAEIFRTALNGNLPAGWSIAPRFHRPPIAEWSRIAAKKYAGGEIDSPAQGPFYIRKSQAEEGNG